MAKGLFTPINPEKYLGNITKIRFLSSWEMKFMQFCDTNPNVIKWGSEEFTIKYFHPIKQKIVNYFPDFIVKYKDQTGALITEVIEVKPSKESPIIGSNGQLIIHANISTYDKVQMVINHAKWTAARVFCATNGIKFRVLTEQEMFRQKPTTVKRKPALRKKK